ncbi:hypothetical protein QTO34_004439 [Cnephaeus nilssonii]|uniref:Uncharacterized protein n=1 Tax=Cnephaeus nilssonii TaxID=3371016 RepID=A0AA40HPC0_CNENI|nr:hypothetical protein QTO34_004439 [Eptesicus nilssonii]
MAVALKRFVIAQDIVVSEFVSAAKTELPLTERFQRLCLTVLDAGKFKMKILSSRVWVVSAKNLGSTSNKTAHCCLLTSSTTERLRILTSEWKTHSTKGQVVEAGVSYWVRKFWSWPCTIDPGDTSIGFDITITLQLATERTLLPQLIALLTMKSTNCKIPWRHFKRSEIRQLMKQQYCSMLPTETGRNRI